MAFERHTFFITGASSGLGLAIGLAALSKEHRVIGTARNIENAQKCHPEFSERGGEWVKLDVTDSYTEQVVGRIVEERNVDVLVNNAGYGLYGSLEDASEREIRDQMETNFFGAVKVVKGAIPTFRRKRRGTIVTMSSVSGMTVSSASGIMYSTSKFALEAISEGLAAQLKDFGIRVLIVEPGLFRTNWLAGSYVTPAAGLTSDYDGGPVDDMLKKYPTLHGAQEGDPQKAGLRIVEVVTGTGMGSGDDIAGCLRLPLGADAVEKARDKVASLTRDIDLTENIAKSTAFENS
jgi:NAD(P)-dependent dehydrogenase (short-subunit alcohol dehydrogenase family)